jgi:hypothetical protein
MEGKYFVSYHLYASPGAGGKPHVFGEGQLVLQANQSPNHID